MRLGKGWISSFDIAPAADLMVVGGSGGLFLYRADSFELIWGRPAERVINQTVISRDGTRIATVSQHTMDPEDQDEIILWDAVTGNRLLIIRPDFSADEYVTIESIAFSPDGQKLAATCSDHVFLWEVADGKLLWIREEKDKFPFSLGFSPDGKILAAGYAAPGGLGMPVPCEACETPAGQSSSAPVILWETESGKRLRILEGHDDEVKDVAFSPDGKMLASGGMDNRVCVWDPANGELLLTLEGIKEEAEGSNLILSLAFSPDGKTLAAGSRYTTTDGRGHGTAVLWDAISGARLRTLGETEGYVEGELEGVAFAPDGKTLFTGPRGWNSGFTIRRWDFSTGEQLQTLDGFTGGVRKFTFQPDGHTLASVSSNDMFYVWDWMRGESMQRKALDGEYNQYDISPDGKTLALLPWGEDRRIILWDAVGWRQLYAITPQGRNC